MTNEQITFINEQLRYLGFAEHTPDQLNVFTDELEFELTQTARYGADTVEAILYFRRSKNYAVHFLSKHTLTLRTVTQSFYPVRGKGITLKEGYNLLCGRAVYKKLSTKEGDEYFAWIQLDLTQKEEEGYRMKRYYENYGFRVAACLDTIELAPYNNWDRAMLIRSLERGNLQPVELLSGKAWIEANPKERTINIHLHNIPASPKEEKSKPRRKRIPIK